MARKADEHERWMEDEEEMFEAWFEEWIQDLKEEEHEKWMAQAEEEFEKWWNEEND